MLLNDNVSHFLFYANNKSIIHYEEKFYVFRQIFMNDMSNTLRADLEPYFAVIQNYFVEFFDFSID